MKLKGEDMQIRDPYTTTGQRVGLFVKPGFTLIELLVVIAIIGILATLVITQVAGAQVRSRNARAQSDIAEAGKGVEQWKINQFSDNAYATANYNTTTTSTVALNGSATPTISKVNINFGTANGVGAIALSGLFTGTEGATAYGTNIAKTPSTSYTYGYITAGATTAAASSYCVGTNLASGSGVNVATGFAIQNGSSLTTIGGGSATAPYIVWNTTGTCQ